MRLDERLYAALNKLGKWTAVFVSKQRRENQATRGFAATRGQPLQLTEDECLCLLAAGCCSLGSVASEEWLVVSPDPPAPATSHSSLATVPLRSALLELAQSVGMTTLELHTFAAIASGRAPSSQVLDLFTRETH